MSSRLADFHKHVALPTELMELIQVSIKIIIKIVFLFIYFQILRGSGPKIVGKSHDCSSFECIYIYYKIVSMQVATLSRTSLPAELQELLRRPHFLKTKIKRFICKSYLKVDSNPASNKSPFHSCNFNVLYFHSYIYNLFSK